VARWEAVSDLREQIRTLLTEDEWAAARRNTINAHYTDADLVRSIWGAVRGLGFKGGRVLEPGSGSGNFIGFAPIFMRDPVQMTGVEVEPTTAAIARRLYPDAEIITSGLEEIPLADGGFDGVVGNVPFGRYKRFDKVHNADLKLSIHDHFVLKSLYATRPGGVVALITSRYTLDAENPEARERMYQLGDLVGAVRLPARAHAAAAGTDVVTDVLFLRRRMDGEEPGDATWLTATKRTLPGHDDELAVNTYFDAHPEYVLGELRAGSREWGPEVTVVGRTDQTPAESLAAAAAAITVEAEGAGLTAAADQRTGAVQTIVTGGTEDALGLDAEGNPTIIENGRPVPLEIHPDQREQLVKLIRLKSLTLALYEAEAATPEPGETPQLARLRAELRVGWRDYRKSHPPLTKPRQHYKFTPAEARARAKAQGLKDVPEGWKARTAFAWIDDDPDAALLFGLEEWDERTGKGTEQQVLLSRVLEPRRLPVRATSHEDAIALAMEYDGGRLDMGRVASLLGTDEESAAAQVADAGLAYRDPKQNGDAWEPSHRYLSGNVRTKLAAAKERAAYDPTFLGNVAALERVQPADLAPSEIKAKIGAPWIPVDVYNDFLAHLGFEDASVLHAGGTVWEVRGAKNGDLARTEWGTGSRPTQDLFTALLRQTESTLQVTYRDNEGRTYVDKDATDAAQEKAKLIAEAFEDWVWDDKTRAARLAKLYNEMFNNLVLPDYSGSALTLPGLISDWTMKEHQNAAIRRIVHEPTALLAHVVGAGKTATMAAGAMELRRTGLAKKPALVVPNHMLKQWTREFRQLYPNARILAISASDLNVKRRAKFMGRIAGGDWDAVILTHEAFNRVPLRPDNMRTYLDQEMRSLREQLDVAAESGMGRNTVKQIEESLANAEAKLQQQIESMGDDKGVFLEDTGVDYLFLDEAHEYKNLRTVSAIPGAAIQGSAKATKLHMVLSWLRETNESDRVATLATGTPIANSVTEAYVLKRYLAPKLLDEMGLDAFDNWAATFGEVVSNLEPDPKGDGYKYKARFSRFFNVPELMSAYRTFADVQMAEDLDLPTPPVRHNEDGQRGETVLIPPTPAQREFIKQLPHKPWVRKPGGVLKALGEGLRASVDLDLVDATEALRELGINPNRFTSTDPTTGEVEIDFTKVAELADAAATDMRSVGGSKDMGSKVPYAAEKITEIWHETKDIVYPISSDNPRPQDLPGGLQLVFLDEGTPGSTAKHSADLYADLRDELVARGMPREAIRFIHEAGTDRKKEKLFADCRSGRVRVLIGSTQKMGTGTNIQDRAVALHHLSYPWRPADMAQRDGRIERRGNLNAPWVENTPDDVRILYYITERTFDEFRLTTLARKARFIGQIQRRDFSLREIEDIGADALNIGMLAALASGDPAILQLAEATAERSRLQGLARSWDRAQDSRTQQLKDIDDFLGRADFALERMREAAPNRRPTTGDAFAMTVDDATYRSRDAAANALGARMAAIAGDQSIRPGQRIPIGTLGGQDFHAEIAYGSSGRRQLRLRFAWGHVVPIGQREDRAQWQASSVTASNGRGAIQSLEHFLNHLDGDLEKLDTSAASQRGRREEIAANLRPKDDNPYRIQARSKERQERALGKLVVANEKEAALAERVERAASVSEEAAEEGSEELTALREQIAALRKVITDEDEVQARAQGLEQPDRDTASESDFGEETTEPEAAEAAAPANIAERQEVFGGRKDHLGTEQPGTDVGTSAESLEASAPEESREQRRGEALEGLFSGTAPKPGGPGLQDEAAAAGDDPGFRQIIAQDLAAMAGGGWTHVVQPFASQREATFEQNHVQVVYERWAATQTALPMLVDAEGELTDEDPGITNPAGVVASWQHRSRVAAATAGPTGGRMVVEQFEGLAQAARRADAYLAERDAYAAEGDRALLLQVADTADRYARRLAVTLDVLAQQRAGERQESQPEVRMREVRTLESAMEYLGDQGADFRMDRQNTTITDREVAGTQLREDLLRTMREFAELPPERQYIDPDFRVMYADIRGIPLYVGWSGIGTPEAQAVLGFDQLPLLDRDSITSTELEEMTPTQLIDRVDGKLALDALGAVLDRELTTIQDLLAAGAQGHQDTTTDDAPTTETGGPNAEPQQNALQLNQWWETSSGEAVPEGHQPFTDSSVQLVPGDTVRAGWRMYMEDRQLHYHSVTIEEGPDPRDGYYVCRNADGLRRRLHPRDIVAVPEGSRLLPGNARALEETPAPAPTEAEPAETAPLQGQIDALGDRVSVTHIGGPQSDVEPAAEEPAALAPAKAEQHAEPSPPMARSAAVLRYYEPLLKRHKLSGKDVVAYIDQPGVGYAYDPDNPLLDLVHEIGKVGERVGGSFRRSYNEWVNYQVGAKRAAQSEQLTNLSLDLITLYGGETEPLFEVHLETILGAPPGTVIDLPDETAPEEAPAAIVINHDAEGTTVKDTRRDDQPVRDALRDHGFRWSRRQSMWYQRRDTPLEVREEVVRGLRAFLDRIGTAYTYNGPDVAPQESEETTEAPQETTPAAATGTEPADPSAPAATEISEATAELGSDPGMEAEASPGEPLDGESMPGSGADEPEPAPPAHTETDVPAAPAADDGAPDTEPDGEAAPDGEADADGAAIVQTPDGPGRVIGTDGDLVLVSTQSGTRVFEGAEVQWPDGTARPEDGERAAKARQNAADLAQASTAEGIELRYGNGNRLIDLDVEAGHGTVVDTDGAVIGWVRARIGDDGRRYWWGQDARGGAPDDMPFHEALPPSAGVPAIRAASNVRTDKTAVKEPAHRGLVPAEYASREVRLTTAQVRELRRLTLASTYSDGAPIEPPQWVASHRKYHLNVAQMQALGEAAQAAADAFPGVTAEERRTAKVLRNAAERFEYEVYDTARWRATIPPIGESDPYAGPYQRRPRTDTAEEQQTEPDTPALSAEAAPAAARASDPPEVAETSTPPEQQASPADSELAIVLATPPTSSWDEPEPLQQSEQRFGGPERMAQYAERADIVPTNTNSSTVWLDGRLVGYVADLNQTVGAAHDHSWPAELRRPPGPRFESRPVFGHRDAVSALLEDRQAAVAELVARALQSPVPREAVDENTAWTLNVTLGTIRLFPAYAGEDQEAAERLSALRQVVENLSAGQLTSSDLADDLALAHDGLLWVAELANTSGPYMVKAAEELAVLLAATRPDDPRAWRPDPSATADTVVRADVEQSTEAPAPDRPTRRTRTRTQEGTEQLGLFGDVAPNTGEDQSTPDAPEESALQELDVVLLDVDESPLDPAEPYATDAEAQADIRGAAADPPSALAVAPGTTPEVEGRSTTDVAPAIEPAAEDGQLATGRDPVTEQAADEGERAEHGPQQPAQAGVVGPPQTAGPPVDNPAAKDQEKESTSAPESGMAAAAAVPSGPDGLAADMSAAAVPVDEMAQGAPVSDGEAELAPDEEEAVEAQEPEAPASITTAPDGQGAVLASPVSATGEQADVALGVDVEDPPAPRRYVESVRFPMDPDYQLDLSGVDGQGPDSGEVQYRGAVVATLHRSAGEAWFARLAVERVPIMGTLLDASPQVVAHQAAILFAVATGTPYGARPTAAMAEGPWTPAEVLRSELRETALQHQATVAEAIERVAQGSPPGSRWVSELHTRLNDMADALSEEYDSRQMGFHLGAVDQAARALLGGLPQESGELRRALTFPLAHLVHDVGQLRARVQATRDAMQSGRPSAAPQQAVAGSPQPEVQQAPAASLPDPGGRTVAGGEQEPEPVVGRPAFTAVDDPAQVPTVQDTALNGASEPIPGPAEGAPEPAAAEPDRPAVQASPEPLEDVPADARAGAESDEGALPVVGDSVDARGAVGGELGPVKPAEPIEDLPLWTGQESSAEEKAATVAGPPVDLMDEFQEVQQAWTEIVPPESGTAEDLGSDVEGDVRTLQQLLVDAAGHAAATQPAPAWSATTGELAPPRPEAPAPAPLAGQTGMDERDPQRDAAAVNAALRKADVHGDVLQGLPEWQQVQTVRGALGNLVRVLKDRAGERFSDLMSDGRVGDFFRRLGIRVCERIAGWAQAGADRLRRDDERGPGQRPDLPSAEALLELGDAAFAYSSARRGGTPPRPSSESAGGVVDIPEMRKMAEALRRPLPGVAKGKATRVSAAAARGRSTTAKRTPQKPGGTTPEPAGHLRRDPDHQQVRKPNQR
jgi:N12 class adenine-specific DNA methylase/SAM-dependent methyltransferase